MSNGLGGGPVDAALLPRKLDRMTSRDANAVGVASIKKVVRNLLGSELHLRLDFGRSIDQVVLPAGTGTPVVFPVPDPPGRKTRTVARPPRASIAIHVASLKLEPTAEAALGQAAADVLTPPKDLYVEVSLQGAPATPDFTGVCAPRTRSLSLGGLSADWEETLLIALSPALVHRILNVRPRIPFSDSIGRKGGGGAQSILLSVCLLLRVSQEAAGLELPLRVRLLQEGGWIKAASGGEEGRRDKLLATAMVNLDIGSLRASLHRIMNGELAEEQMISLGEMRADLSSGGTCGSVGLQLALLAHPSITHAVQSKQRHGAKQTRGERALSLYPEGPWMVLPPVSSYRTYPAPFKRPLELAAAATSAAAGPEEAEVGVGVGKIPAEVGEPGTGQLVPGGHPPLTSISSLCWRSCRSTRRRCAPWRLQRAPVQPLSSRSVRLGAGARSRSRVPFASS